MRGCGLLAPFAILIFNLYLLWLYKCELYKKEKFIAKLSQYEKLSHVVLVAESMDNGSFLWLIGLEIKHNFLAFILWCYI
jgi:hypothetical protein